MVDVVSFSSYCSCLALSVVAGSKRSYDYEI
jgi:hypothetical protein